MTTGEQEVGLVSGGNDAARGKQVLGLVVTGAVKAKSGGVKLGAAVGTRNGETASRTFLDDDPLFLSNMITTTVTMITMATATALMNHLVKKLRLGDGCGGSSGNLSTIVIWSFGMVISGTDL